MGAHDTKKLAFLAQNPTMPFRPVRGTKVGVLNDSRGMMIMPQKALAERWSGKGVENDQTRGVLGWRGAPGASPLTPVGVLAPLDISFIIYLAAE